MITKSLLPQLLCLLLCARTFAQADNYKAEPSAGTWFPAKGISEKATSDSVTAVDSPLSASVNDFLKDLNGSFRPVVCWYSGSTLDSTKTFTTGNLKTGENKWTCQINSSDKSGLSGNALDLMLKFTLTKGTAQSAGVAAAFDFSGWTTDNYILVPAVLYGGNRFHILPIGYPPYIHDEKDRPLDMPVTVTNIPHLNRDGSHAKVEMNTGNVATPLLSFFNPKKKMGFILLAGQGTRFGNNGLFVEEDAGLNTVNKHMSFVVSAPGVRVQRYEMCGRAASGDKGAGWKTGDELTLGFKLYSFPATDMAAFYEKVMNVRKALTGANSFANVTPYSAAAGLVLAHFDKDKWFEDKNTAYYSNRPGDPNPYHFQIGWGGMPVLAYPTMLAQTPGRLRRMLLLLDNMVFKAQGKTGLFYAIYNNGVIFSDEHGKMSERPAISMTRRSMDLLYFTLRMFDLMKQRGQNNIIRPEWEKSLHVCADGLLKVWAAYGQFGQFINVDNGKMDINGSTAGCAAGAGLVLASKYFSEPKYLEVAEAATKMYYERDFLKGYAGGGAAEILQSPDSQAPWDMVESCMALYEATGKQEWLDRARFAANMLATWMVSYDYKFPKGSDMERAGTHAAGSFFASSQNNHAAPGYYILSGDCLLRLFRATGDRRYAEMYKDQSHNIVQYVGAPYNPLRHESGYVTERVQLSDWDGGNMGSVDNGDSNMAWETLAALTCIENPGIYLHTDDSTFLLMDHVEAKIIKRDKTGLTLRITNPTAYDAIISILAETAEQAKKPLSANAFSNWPKVELKAGGSKTITIPL
ncbi:hypothetical protein ACX0G9_12880 [Flavitalea flava]